MYGETYWEILGYISSFVCVNVINLTQERLLEKRIGIYWYMYRYLKVPYGKYYL